MITLHDFDAEAMIFKDGKIYLFSKEWASLKVSKYAINPDTEEEQSIQKTEEFKTNFLVKPFHISLRQS